MIQNGFIVLIQKKNLLHFTRRWKVSRPLIIIIMKYRRPIYNQPEYPSGFFFWFYSMIFFFRLSIFFNTVAIIFWTKLFFFNCYDAAKVYYGVIDNLKGEKYVVSLVIGSYLICFMVTLNIIGDSLSLNVQ